MGLQKFRADSKGEACENGAVPWYTRWIGGPSVAKIESCPTPIGVRTVYVTGQPDTFYTLPAACSFKGRTVRGFLTWDSDAGPCFHADCDSWIYPRTE
jgi:hypothetical protein